MNKVIRLTITIAILTFVIGIALRSCGDPAPAPPIDRETGSPEAPSNPGDPFGKSGEPDVELSGTENRPAGEDAPPVMLVDRNGEPLKGNGKLPALESFVMGGRMVAWIEGIDDGEIVLVLPNPNGQFPPPEGPSSRRIRILATDSGDTGTILYSNRTLSIGELPGSRVTLVPPAPLTLELGCRDGSGEWLAADMKVCRRLGADGYRTVARLSVPAELTEFELHSGPGDYFVARGKVKGLETEQFKPERKDVVFGPAGRASCVFEVSKGIELAVVLKDHDGAPFDGATVVLKYMDGDVWRLYAKPPRKDGSGRYVFADLPPGELILQISAKGHFPQSHRVKLPAGEPSTREFRLEEGGAAIRVKFVTKSGPSPDEVNYFLLIRRGADPETVQAFTTVDRIAPLEFQASGLGVGEYEFVVDLGVLSVTVIAGISGADVDLGTIDLEPVLPSGKCTAEVSISCPDKRWMHAVVLYRHTQWPEGVWLRTHVPITGRTVPLDRLTEGRYLFRLSPARLDASKFDLSGTTTAEVTRDQPARVKIELPLKR